VREVTAVLLVARKRVMAVVPEGTAVLLVQKEIGNDGSACSYCSNASTSVKRKCLWCLKLQQYC
jgi:hypothetical protein